MLSSNAVTDNITAFIADGNDINWFNTNLPLFHCIFQTSLYNDKLFEEFQIQFPETLNRAVIKRRSEFLAGRYSAKKALEKIGITNGTVPIGKDRSPVWPDSIVGAISHCGNNAVAVVNFKTNCKGIGIDIENIMNIQLVENIQEQIIRGNEIDVVSNEAVLKPLMFTLSFSAKESFFKAAYPTIGHYFNFSVISIEHIDLESNKIFFCINEHLHDCFPAGLCLQANFHLLPDKKVITLVVID